jgi:mannose-6-phosphate isomerase-like protein (cupin superfamily)
MVSPYVAKLKKEAKHNVWFRKVLFTGGHSQLVVMCLQPGEEIGTEVHEVDQLIYVVEGEGKVVLEGRGEKIDEGTVVCVPARTQHNVVNTHNEPMQLFTVYAPPQHRSGTAHRTKADAETEEVEVIESQPV